ncbi:UNVERIFIED_CONTAM: hypothetical protein K2H54_002432 [Gekko kuhli]
MAHSGRWRFPARPGTGAWGRRGLGGCRVRVPAVRSLREEPPEERPRERPGGGGGAAAGSGGGGAGGTPCSSGPPAAAPAPPPPAASSAASAGVAPGFDAALQVSAAIGINLRRFRAACGAEAGSGEACKQAAFLSLVGDLL